MIWSGQAPSGGQTILFRTEVELVSHTHFEFRQIFDTDVELTKSGGLGVGKKENTIFFKKKNLIYFCRLTMAYFFFTIFKIWFMVEWHVGFRHF